MPSLRELAPVVLVATLALTSCAHEPDTTSLDAGSSSSSQFGRSSANSLQLSQEIAATAENPLKHLESCDDVALVLDAHLDGLSPEPTNTVDGWGVFCDWVANSELNDEAQLRSVGVALAVLPSATATPDPDTLVRAEGGTLHEAAWLSERGGIATSLTVNSGDEITTTTTVRLPGLEATITVGYQSVHNSLDADAAIALVQHLVQ